jgi:hypothetical protein
MLAALLQGKNVVAASNGIVSCLQNHSQNT